MADELAAFIAARLDEDEAGYWSVHDVAKCDALLYEEDMADAARREPVCDCGYPARVLREIQAKRRTLALYGDLSKHGRGPVRSLVYPAITDALAAVLRYDAAVWSDHPDYRPEWTVGAPVTH